jgi:hypothetical protein
LTGDIYLCVSAAEKQKGKRNFSGASLKKPEEGKDKRKAPGGVGNGPGAFKRL